MLMTNSVERRRELVRYITEFGGTYNKDLGRTCTHLIAAKPTTEANQSEKVKWAMKENVERERKRRKWKKDEQDMAIVYEEWIWDCVAYRGRFAEQGYDASKPRPRGKVRAGKLGVANGHLADPSGQRMYCEDVCKKRRSLRSLPKLRRKRTTSRPWCGNVRGRPWISSETLSRYQRERNRKQSPRSRRKRRCKWIPRR